jgi:hypothetical protein
METERGKRLADFVSWVGANIRGDEKGEAKVYLDRFFQALGHSGVKEAGATLEERIKKTEGKVLGPRLVGIRLSLSNGSVVEFGI